MRGSRALWSAVPPPPQWRLQQRLFTGGLFSEEVNDSLQDFARRHKVASVVWIPVRAFDVALQPYNVFILPSAARCDVALLRGGTSADVALALGHDRLLVNADHTSSPAFFESFRDKYVVPRSRDRTGGQMSLPTATYSTALTVTRATQGARVAPPSRSSSSLRTAQFYYPLSATGAPLSGQAIVRHCVARQKLAGLLSNYWLRIPKPRTRSAEYINAEETHLPGRYNPIRCVAYEPHTLTNLPFPHTVACLMRERAVNYGYVSRLWLTRHELERLLCTTVRPEREHDSPTIFTTHFSGGLAGVEFFCADQLALDARLLPTMQEVELAMSGVAVARATLPRVYPALASLLFASCAPGDGDKTASVSSAQDHTEVHFSAAHADQSANPDAARRLRFAAAMRRYDTIRLLGFPRRCNEERLLRMGLDKLLHRECVLRGFDSAYFINTRDILAYCLNVRHGELGVPATQVPVCLWHSNIYLAGECWFNVCQLTEPAVALELFTRTPTHLLTRIKLSGKVRRDCARLQLSRHYRSNEWVPSHCLELTGWHLREGAPGVPYIPTAAFAAFRRYKWSHAFLVNVDEVVELEVQDMNWWRGYRPVDERGRGYLQQLRMAMLLRAYERGYKSPRWVCLGPPSPTARETYKCKTEPTPVRADIGQPLKPIHFFAHPPLVTHHGCLFANEEELAVPLASRATATQSTAEAQAAASNADDVTSSEAVALTEEDGEDDGEVAADVDAALGSASVDEENVEDDGEDEFDQIVTEDVW